MPNLSARASYLPSLPASSRGSPPEPPSLPASLLQAFLHPVNPVNTVRHHLFELGRDTCLLADLVGGYSINFGVPFDWNHLGAVCVYGIVTSLPQEMEAAFRQVPNEVTPFYRHAGLLLAVAR